MDQIPLRQLIHSEELSLFISWECGFGTSPKNTQRRGEGWSYHGNISTMCIQILCGAGMLPYANVVWGWAGPDDSGGRCWSGLGHPCCLCPTGTLPYRCCLAKECPPAWRNQTHPSSCSPLAHPLHHQTWLLEHTPAGLGDTDKGLTLTTADWMPSCLLRTETTSSLIMSWNSLESSVQLKGAVYSADKALQVYQKILFFLLASMVDATDHLNFSSILQSFLCEIIIFLFFL